jgi:hypothetical protein
MKKLKLSVDDLFVVMTPERKKLLENVTKKVEASGIDIESLDIRYLKNIFWIESLAYLANKRVPKEDKELYLQLWESSTTASNADLGSIFRKIRIPSYVPTRRLILLDTDSQGLHFVEEKTGNKVTINNPSVKKGRKFYDQISLQYAVGV